MLNNLNSERIMKTIRAKLIIDIETDIEDETANEETLRYLVEDDLSDSIKLNYKVFSCILANGTGQSSSNCNITHVMPSAYRTMTNEELEELENIKLNEMAALRTKLTNITNEQFYRKLPECRPH